MTMTTPPDAAVVTLLTDFGTVDHFVGAMKGVVLAIAPRATLVDLTHGIAPQDVRAAAFALLAAYDVFPAGTVHVAVVDPGVGSERRPIVVATARHRFVGPDNGLFSYVLDREPDARVFHVTGSHFFRHPVSATFHGRDVFAPVAAALAAGAAPEALGAPIADPVRLDPLHPQADPHGHLRAAVLHVDRFGNCVTNLTREHLPHGLAPDGAVLEVNGRTVSALRRFYAEAGGNAAEVFAIWGSSNFLELSANRASAAALLGIGPGDPLLLRPAGASEP
jgi:S-adenosyl-L-methionine hydrolase (adenosine-forming)